VGEQNTLKPKISMSVAVITLVIIAIVLTLTTFAAITTNQKLTSIGTVTTSANLGVYSNSACTISLSSIDWGTLTPGGNTTQIVYIKNTGIGVSLALSMVTSNWTPANANGPITLTWNQEGTRLAPGQATAATLTLTVASSIADISNFNTQITLTGTN
jgi:hypothetical protein